MFHDMATCDTDISKRFKILRSNSTRDIENLKKIQIYFLLLKCIPKEMGDAQFFEINKKIYILTAHTQ